MKTFFRLLLRFAPVLLVFVSGAMAAEPTLLFGTSTSGIHSVSATGTPKGVLVPGADASCVRYDPISDRVYYAQRTAESAPKYQLRRVKKDGSNLEILNSAMEGTPTSMAIDGSRSLVFWTTEQNGGEIRRMSFDGANASIVVSANLPKSVEVDPAGGNIYWLEEPTYNLHRANLDGSESISAFIGSFYHSIALDHTRGHVYLGTCDRFVFFQRINFDLTGFGSTPMATFNDRTIRHVTRFALDEVGQRVFFVSRDTNKIETINFDGIVGSFGDLPSEAIEGLTLLPASQDSAPPAGGTFTLSKTTCRPLDLLQANFNGWTDESGPLKYQVKLNGTALGAPGTASTIGFAAPASEGTYTLTGLISDAEDQTAEATQTLVVDGTPPVIHSPGSASGVAPTPAGIAVTFEVTATDAFDPAPSAIATPPSGTVFPVGTTPVTIVARDATGNEATASFNVTVARSYVETTAVAQAGLLAGNRIGTELTDAPGFKLTKLGVPTITNRRIIAVSGAARDGTGKTLTGVLLGQVDGGSTSFSMPLRVGAPVPGTAGLGTGLTWKAFPREPLADYQDDISAASGVELAFHGRVAGPGVTSANDDVLGYYNLPETGDEVLVAFAREGGDAPGVEGGKFKSFISAAMAVRTITFGVLPPARSVMFTAMLQTGPRGSQGPGGVDKTNDMGLWAWEAGQLTLALREGQVIDGRTVRSFVALRGPVGHGHGVTEDLESYHNAATQDGFTTTVLITFDDGGRRLAVAGSHGTRVLVNEGDLSAWVAGPVFGLSPPVPWKRFQSWSRNGHGYTIFQSTLASRPSATNTVIVLERFDGDAVLQLTKGDTLPDGSVLTALASPIVNRARTLAFNGRTNTGVQGGWYGQGTDLFGHEGPGDVAEYHRVGGVAPGANGGVWKPIISNALPEGMGPLFTAKLRAGSVNAPAPGEVTVATDLGLWAVDSFGATHLLIREGQSFAGKTVRTFKALTSVSGSPAQARSFNGHRDVLVWVLATDNTQHLVHFAVP